MKSKRLQKLLDVCNAVREAGGGDYIEALLPSLPGNPKACLIARNLNFDCKVEQDYEGNWVMVASREILEKVAPVLDSKVIEVPTRRYGKQTKPAVKLPRWMGRLAEDFDGSVGAYSKKQFLLPVVSKHKLRQERAHIRARINRPQTFLGSTQHATLVAYEAKLTEAIEAQV